MPLWYNPTYMSDDTKDTTADDLKTGIKLGKADAEAEAEEEEKKQNIFLGNHKKVMVFNTITFLYERKKNVTIDICQILFTYFLRKVPF